MSLQSELSRRSDELWEQWESVGANVNSTADAERIARRELMARSIAAGRPEDLLPLFKEFTRLEDRQEISTLAEALAEKKGFKVASSLWERLLARLEADYWKGLQQYRRQFPAGSDVSTDKDGVRIFLYEQYRFLLALGYSDYLLLMECYGGRGGEKLAQDIRERRRRVFTENLTQRKVTPDDRAMTEKVFWALIDSVAVAKGDTESRIERLGDRLRGFRPKEVLQFGRIVRTLLKESNNWDLWGAAYLINDGASNDGFLAFRGWLVLQGKKRFAESVRNADSMSAWVRPNPDDPAEAEELLYLADEIYEEKTGNDSPGAEIEADGRAKGKKWKESELPTRLPKLWRLTQQQAAR